MLEALFLATMAMSGIDDTLPLSIHYQVPRTVGRNGWLVVDKEIEWKASETAIIIVDMWNKHWSWGATERVDIMAPRMNKVVKTARAKGVTIIHAPSDTMEFYKDHIARKNVLAIPEITPPEPKPHDDPPQPVDSSDGGSDTGEPNSYKAWDRQHPAIEIDDKDYISDNGQEVYNIFAQKGIKNVIIMGVHTNMCVLGRSFAIKAMVRWGFNVVLVRDLTDAMYNPYKPPYVSHEEGTRLIIEYIEKFWCPTILSSDITTPKPNILDSNNMEETKMSNPEVGKPAPNFEAESTSGKRVRLADFKGSWVVLYFYPKAFTPGCTAESCALRDSFNQITEIGVVLPSEDEETEPMPETIILGVSTDTIETQKKFKAEYNLPFDLLSDHEKEISKAYGVLKITGTAERKTFIINPDGNIVYIFDKVNASKHDEEVKEVLSKLRLN